MRVKDIEAKAIRIYDEQLLSFGDKVLYLERSITNNKVDIAYIKAIVINRWYEANGTPSWIDIILLGSEEILTNVHHEDLFLLDGWSNFKVSDQTKEDFSLIKYTCPKCDTNYFMSNVSLSQPCDCKSMDCNGTLYKNC